MSNSFFAFKKFTIHQDRCAMKVGTDGVLLGAWVNTDNCHTMLDIGTGTGLISLMIAQRTNAQIDAIDIDEEACIQASENIRESIFHDKIKVYHSSFDHFSPYPEKKYDLILSNPPYFSDSLKGPDNQRNLARHENSLTLHTLIQKSRTLLQPEGRISLILPFNKKEEILKLAKCHNLHLIRQLTVYPTSDSLPKRILCELSPTLSMVPEEKELIIEISRHKYTADYCRLTQPFYLKM